jgi:hypothetical protein
VRVGGWRAPTGGRSPGGAVTTEPEQPPGPPGGIRRPLLALGAVVAGLLAMRMAAPFVAPPAAVEVTAAGPVAATVSRPAVLEEATGTRLFLGGEDGLLLVDVDRRSVRRVTLPAGAAGADNGLVGRDGVVVAVRGGVAYAASGRPGRPAVPLGPASYAVASASPGRVWLVEETGDPERWFRVREVDLGAAGEKVAAAVLPLGQRPVAGAPGGLLVHVVGPVGGLAVWDPRPGRLGTRLALAASTPLTVVAARGSAVAWVEGATLHLGDLASGRDRVVAPPPGTDGFAAPGAFSPDGRTLAAVTRVGFSTRPALALVDTAQASAVRVAGSEGALSDRCSPCLAWAPAGDWVFFSRIGPGFGIGAYRLGAGRAVTVPVDIPFAFPPSFAATRLE